LPIFFASQPIFVTVFGISLAIFFACVLQDPGPCLRTCNCLVEETSPQLDYRLKQKDIKSFNGAHRRDIFCNYKILLKRNKENNFVAPTLNSLKVQKKDRKWFLNSFCNRGIFSITISIYCPNIESKYKIFIWMILLLMQSY